MEEEDKVLTCDVDTTLRNEDEAKSPEMYTMEVGSDEIQGSLLPMLAEFFQTEAYTDATFLCNNSKILKAHRLVLAAASPLMKELLEGISEAEPVVSLPDVEYEDMKAILEVLYTGRCVVSCEKEESFKFTADLLSLQLSLTSEVVENSLQTDVEDVVKAAVEISLIEGDFGNVSDMEHLASLTLAGLSTGHGDGFQVAYSRADEVDTAVNGASVDGSNEETKVLVKTKKEPGKRGRKRKYPLLATNLQKPLSQKQKTTLDDETNKPFSCSLCKETFSHQHKLNFHMRVHRRRRPGSQKQYYKCDVCFRLFKNENEKERHKIVHRDEKPHACTLCPRQFKYKDNLRQHLLAHTGEKSQTCETCGRGFNHRGDLEKHRRTHTGERPYCCEVCGQTFKLGAHLQRHMYNHGGERPFSCDTCGRKFVQVSDLKIHQRIHTGEKPYQCDNCGRTFTRLDYLKKHLNVHLGLQSQGSNRKLYCCEICGQEFTQSSAAKRHLLSHQEDFEEEQRLYCCDFCGGEFTDIVEAKKHILTHSSVDMEYGAAQPEVILSDMNETQQDGEGSVIHVYSSGDTQNTVSENELIQMIGNIKTEPSTPENNIIIIEYVEQGSFDAMESETVVPSDIEAVAVVNDTVEQNL